MFKFLKNAVLGPGVSDPEVRKRVYAKVEQPIWGRTAAPLPAAALDQYIDKLANYAYKVTDEDLVRLKAEGLEETEVFELTITAAVAAGVTRLEKGLDLLKAK